MGQRRQLSCTQSVEAARILFELNTDPAQIAGLAREAGLPACADAAAEQQLCREWYGFVHAAVVAGLMVHAPSAVVAAYLRDTTLMLTARGLEASQCEAFVDTVFSAYMELLACDRAKDCPGVFFHRLCGVDTLEALPARTVIMISGAMAMTVGAIADKLEKYDMLSE